MDPGQHAADRSAGPFDGRHVEGNDPNAPAYVRDLRRVERAVRARRYGEDRPLPTLQLKRVPRKSADLVKRQVDDLSPRGFQPVPDLGPARRVGDRFEGDEDDVGADAHHEVGMVDALPTCITRFEEDRLEVEMRAEALQRDGIGAVGLSHVGDPLDMVMLSSV